MGSTTRLESTHLLPTIFISCDQVEKRHNEYGGLYRLEIS